MKVTNSNLKQTLVNHLRERAHVRNDFDESAAISDVYRTSEFSERQVDLLMHLHNRSQYETNLDEEWAFKQVLKMPNITENQDAVVRTGRGSQSAFEHVSVNEITLLFWFVCQSIWSARSPKCDAQPVSCAVVQLLGSYIARLACEALWLVHDSGFRLQRAGS